MVTKKFREIESIFWMAFGLFLCYLSWQAHLGTFQEPGPGFVAFIAGSFIFAVGLIMFLSQLLLSDTSCDMFDPIAVFQGVPISKLVYTVALLVVYAVLLGSLGYIVTTFLLMWGLLYDREKRNWVVSSFSSLLIVTSSYLVFEVWLRSQLPRGVLPWW